MPIVLLEQKSLELDSEAFKHAPRLLLPIFLLSFLYTCLIFLLLVAKHFEVQRIFHLILKHLLQLHLPIEHHSELL